MQRLARVGSSSNQVIREEVDSSVLDTSVLPDPTSLDGPQIGEDSASVAQLDEARLRWLVDEGVEVTDDDGVVDGLDGGLAHVAVPGSAPSDVSSDSHPGEWEHRGPVPATAGAQRLKRAVDVVGSLALLATLSPVLATCSVIVRRGSRGPILFRQKRVGQNGRSFTMLKFRTMYVDADPSVHEAYVKRYIEGDVGADDNEGAAVFKLVGDRRVTPAGRWLRRLSLDELPQLVNVLRGEMSLVGPRPPLPYEVEHYRPRDLQRLRARPGITGLWQVSGRNQTTFDEMIDLDVQYISRWSLWLDLWILCRTIPVVFLPDGH
jgi:lipopolysaccharide/colanic/teichoic acid biosynthesis glycosyltransferase